jgi:hypothetical protein
MVVGPASLTAEGSIVRLGSSSLQSSADMVSVGNYEVVAQSVVSSSAQILGTGEILGEKWSIVAEENEVWSEVSAGNEMWSEVEPGDEVWSVISAGNESWTQPSVSDGNWNIQ